MLTERQKDMINNEFKDVEIEINPDFEAYGATYLKRYGNRTKPAIILKGNPVKDDPIIDEAIRVHEYGHIYCGHLWINHTKQKKLMKNTLKVINPDLKLTETGYHHIQNICMDIEVNTTILTVNQFFYLRDHDMGPCDAESYEAGPGLRYMKYYENVLQKLSDEATSKQSEQGLSQSEAQAIFEQLAEQADIGLNLGGMSEESDNAEQDGRKDSSTAMGRSDDDERSDSEYRAAISGDNPASSSEGDGYGTSNSSADVHVEVEDTGEKAIGEVLKKIVTRERSFKVIFDKNKLANRGSRGNTNLRYTSVRRKLLRTEEPKFAFIVDISSSMDEDVVTKIIGQLKRLSGRMNKKSELITWNTRLNKRYSILELPRDIRTGGCTDMASAVTYCTEEGFSDIILISDFETPDMTESLKNSSSNVYLIAYGTNSNSVQRTGGYELLKGAWLVRNDQVEAI